MSEAEPEQLSLDAVGADVSPDAAEPEAPAPAAAPDPVPSPFPPTAEQAAAIDARDRDVFLEAGAGTGKTRVLVDRYCDAVDLDEIEPERILAFTFTEKAAAEMRRRVRVELMRRARGAESPERRTRLTRAARAGEGAPITTIHGYCRRILSSHPVAAGLDPRFRVLDSDESSRLSAIGFERALEERAGTDDNVARIAAGYRNRLSGLILGTHGDLRNQGQRRPKLPPLQISAFEGGTTEATTTEDIEFAASSYGALRTLLDAYSETYAEAKANRSGVDFDDLQLLALELLENNASVANSYAERFDHLLVDEFQDTSPLQVGLVRALRGPQTRLFVVGDENQSIYAFRGADLASFRAERSRIAESGGQVLPLTGSFRSRPEIVAAVNAIGNCLLEEFRDLRVGKLPESEAAEPAVDLLLTERGGWKDEGIEISTAAVETEPNRIAEARALALRLRELAEAGVPRRSMVLLLRAFSHVDAYAEALELAGLDPYVVGGRGYWSSQQVEDALKLLACVANPLDDESLFGSLASPAAGLSPDALWILRRAAGRRRPVWPAVERHVLGNHEPPDPEREPEEAEAWQSAADWIGKLPPEDRERLDRFAGRLDELRQNAALSPLDALVERTLETFDYDLAALTMPGGSRRAANLLKLVRLAAEFESHEGRDLRGFLTYAADRAAMSDREAEATIAAEDHDGVTVMTIHAAKGLEFDCVAVADLGRPMTSSGAPTELRLAFGAGAEEDGEDGESGPRVALRLARAGDQALTLDGYKDLNDDAARADSQESGRLAYVAASRAREHLILSGLYDGVDLEGGRKEIKPSHSVLSRLLPELAVTEHTERATVPSALARDDLEAEFDAPDVAVTIHPAGPQTAAALQFDEREDEIADDPPAGGRPPMLALAERGGSAARSLSYAALADYNRCGYRFLTERVLGLGLDGLAAGPLDPEGRDESGGPAEHDEDPEDPGLPDDDGEGLPAALVSASAFRHSRLGFGRAVHDLLEASARAGWASPTADQIGAVLAREGVDPDSSDRAAALVNAWLESPLLAELREAGASFRPEVPFRVALGEETVLRGTIDLLAEIPGRPPVIIDYKTDSAVPAAGDPLPESYEIQRALYAHAVAEATGAKAVESAYVFLSDPANPMSAELDAEAVGGGREWIERLVARIRAREFGVTDAPHAALCHDCPARARLCPHPREVTLAKTPPADAGAAT